MIIVADFVQHRSQARPSPKHCNLFASSQQPRGKHCCCFRFSNEETRAWRCSVAPARSCSWRVTSGGIPAQTEPRAPSPSPAACRGRGAVTGRRDKSSFSDLVLVAVPPSQGRVRVKASPGPHLLEAFPWDREQGLNVAPKPQEMPPPPSSPFDHDVPGWLLSACQMCSVFLPQGLCTPV